MITITDSPFVGLFYDQNIKMYTANVKINGHMISLGQFERNDDAFDALMNGLEMMETLKEIYKNV